MRLVRSLKGRLTVITGVAIVVTGTVVLLFGFFIARSALRDQTFSSMEGVVSRARGAVDAVTGTLGEAADLLAEDARIQADLALYVSGSADRAATAADLSEVLLGLDAATSLFESVAVAAPDGTIIASVASSPGAVSPVEVSGSLLREASAGQPAFEFGIRSGRFVIDTMTPVIVPGTDRILGYSFISGAESVLVHQLTDTSGLDSSGKLILSETEGARVRVAVFGRSPRKGTEEVTIADYDPATDAAPVRAANGEKGEGESTLPVLGEVVVSYDYMPSSAWGITATADAARALAPIRRLRDVMIIVVFVLLFGGAALAFVIARSIARPITELQEGVKALAAGEMGTRVVIEDGLEVTELAREFNEMASRLKELYDTLERKVEERTHELKDANERLRILDDLKSDFVSTASHELRGPLASMKMGVATVGHEMVGPLNDEQKQMLEIAERNIDRLTRLTGDLLDLTKIEAGQLDLDLDQCDIYELAREVAEADEPLARERGLRLSVESKAGPVVARCDRDRVHQVIVNLVGNAINFTDEGSVTIRVDRVPEGASPDGEPGPGGGPAIRVCVQDTGAGIPAEVVDTIFEKWSQAHSDTRSEKRGTGLGLAISRGIVEAHGGEISVESALDEGSTFCFDIPVRGPDA
ncbi:MAG: HAMP domain-containing histidine kinase [Actinobacteria bacterium]|nr:HAMP domain-containing histidine kinase [Actinomycetota bacterium]MBU1944441.1 HAMP domain-containing histidine kinase [Actinomycetota bacterium]MBU2688227.1 HAMP domain-containing histidine kinase [Actinomycetota bacterium]